MNQITEDKIKLFSNKLNENKINIIKRNALSNNKLADIVKNRDVSQKRDSIFYKHIDVKVKNTNQKSSGRCWIFALLNLVRLDMIKKYDLEDNFEFSQNYLFFWDKLEKSNFFIQNIIKTKKHKIDSRLIQFILEEPVSDGGQWNMLVNLVNKYGIIPKTSMNETFSSSNTSELNFMLNNKLRSIAYEIRETNTNKKIDDYLEEIYKLLVLFLGEPPSKIVWKYYSIQQKQKKYNITNDITPKEFYRIYVPYNINDMVCLVNAPCESKPFYNLLNLRFFGNVVDGQSSRFINIPIDEMIQIAKKSIDNNKAIWFGSDVDKYAEYKEGFLDTDYFNYNSIIEDKIKMNKGTRLNYSSSRITHAMIMKGYDKINHKITKWLIENSWGEHNELNGDLIMSNNWFKEYVMEIVVDKKFVPKKILDVYKRKPIILEPWDPLGLLLDKSNKTKKYKKKNKNTKKKIVQ